MPRKRIAKVRRKQQAKRRSGFWIIGGVVLLAVIVTGALILSNEVPVAEGSYVTVEPQEWPMEDGKALGPADAPVVVQEFSDFQCPYCRLFHENVQQRIIDDYVPTGKVRFEYRHFIVIDNNVGGNESRRAAQASECAAEETAFWDYSNMLFANQQGEGVDGFSDARLRAFAGALNLDTEAFDTCFNARQTADSVVSDENMAIKLQVSGTPSLFVNGKKVENPLDYSQVKAAIDEALGVTQ